MKIFPERKVNSLESFLYIRQVLLKVGFFRIVLVYRRLSDIQVKVTLHWYALNVKIIKYSKTMFLVVSFLNQKVFIRFVIFFIISVEVRYFFHSFRLFFCHYFSRSQLFFRLFSHLFHHFYSSEIAEATRAEIF